MGTAKRRRSTATRSRSAAASPSRSPTASVRRGPAVPETKGSEAAKSAALTCAKTESEPFETSVRMSRSEVPTTSTSAEAPREPPTMSNTLACAKLHPDALNVEVRRPLDSRFTTIRAPAGSSPTKRFDGVAARSMVVTGSTSSTPPSAGASADGASSAEPSSEGASRRGTSAIDASRPTRRRARSSEQPASPLTTRSALTKRRQIAARIRRPPRRRASRGRAVARPRSNRTWW